MLIRPFQRSHRSLVSAAIVFAALIGCALILFSCHTIYHNTVARQWPVTKGQIVSSHTFLQDKGLGHPGNAKVARAEVRYVYNVNGREYHSSNVSYARGIGATRLIYDPSIAIRYPEGELVRVAYNPAQPSDAVIEVSTDPYLVFFLGVFLVISFVGYQFWLGRDRCAAEGTQLANKFATLPRWVGEEV